MKKIVACLVLLCGLMSLTGCTEEFLFGNQSTNNNHNNSNIIGSVNVRFNTGESRIYEITRNGTVVDFIAEPGTRLTGVVTESGVQIATSDGIMRLSSQLTGQGLITANATYSSAVTSYTTSTAWEGNPHSITFYSSTSVVWSCNERTGDDSELALISSIKCNPYASLTLKMSVDVKGDGTSGGYSENSFVYKISVKNETIARDTVVTASTGNSYNTFSTSGRIKALQLQNANFEVSIYIGATLANTTYYAKNIRLQFIFDY